MPVMMITKGNLTDIQHLPHAQKNVPGDMIRWHILQLPKDTAGTL